MAALSAGCAPRLPYVPSGAQTGLNNKLRSSLAKTLRSDKRHARKHVAFEASPEVVEISNMSATTARSEALPHRVHTCENQKPHADVFTDKSKQILMGSYVEEGSERKRQGCFDSSFSSALAPI